MIRYNALLVEDSLKDIEVAEIAARKTPGVNLLVARSRKEALEIIRTSYLHAAFVDLRLNADNDLDKQGLYVIQDLQDYRPSCRRFLMTAWAHSHRDMVYELLRPGSQKVEGLVNKNDFNQDFGVVLTNLFKTSESKEIVISGLEDIVRCLGVKGVGRPISQSALDVQLSPDEVREAIENVLCSTKQGEIIEQDIVRIDLELIGGGRSRACVAKGRPVLVNQGAGIWCVIKVGLKADCLKEVANYSRYVRWTVSINRRVELLAHSAQDLLGAVCYTFAHASPENVTTLEDYIASARADIQERLITLFDAQHKELYSVTHEEENLGKYFAQIHKLDAEEGVREMDRVLTSHAEEWGLVRRADGVFSNAATKIDLNRIHGIIHRARCNYLACIVHGDLNASNVLVGVGDELDTRMAVIDYSHTGPGPASFDFAVLQSHLRLITCKGLDAREILELALIERTVWTHGKLPLDSSEQVSLRGEGFPFWARTSITLWRLTRANFKSMPDNELLLTAVLWALKLMRNHSLGTLGRLRLMVWVNSLASQVDC